MKHRPMLLMVLTAVAVTLVVARVQSAAAQGASCQPDSAAAGKHCSSAWRLFFEPHTHQELFAEDAQYEGADNWPVTWSSSDDQVTVWGDGHGANSPSLSSSGNVSLGVARVGGARLPVTPARFETTVQGATRQACAKALQHPEQLSEFADDGVCGKSYAIVAVHTPPAKETLLMWVSPGSGGDGYASNTLFASDDGKHFKALFTVKRARTTASKNGGLISPAFLQAGPGYTQTGQNNDDYLYLYWIYHDPKPRSAAHNAGLHIQGGVKTGDGQWRTGKVYLSRVLRDQFADPTRYQFFSGDGFTGDLDIRVAQVADVATPVFQSTLGVGWTMSVAYLPGLTADGDVHGKYLLMTEHVKTLAGHMGFYESDTPSGPWRLIHRYQNLTRCLGSGVGANAFYFNISTRWYAGNVEDGQSNRIPFIFSGVRHDDSFNTVHAQLVHKQDRAKLNNRAGRQCD